MGSERNLVILCALAALIAGSARPQPQMPETVDVNIVNQSSEPAEIRVVDEVCEKVAFEGQVLPNATITVSLCPDRVIHRWPPRSSDQFESQQPHVVNPKSIPSIQELL